MSDLECSNVSAAFDHRLYQKWQNYSPFLNQTADLQSYVCAMTRHNEFIWHMRQIQGVMNVISGLVGLISSVLILFTFLKNKKFPQHSFFYFRYVAFLEIVDSLIIFWCHGISWVAYSTRTRSFAWSSFFGIGVSIGNFVTLCVDLITVQVSIERAVACLFPARFHLLDNRRVVYGICVGTFVFSMILNAGAPFSYRVVQDPGSHTPCTYTVHFLDVYDGLSKSLEIAGYMVSVAVAVTCALVVIGVLKFLKLRRALIQPQQNRISSSEGNQIPQPSNIQARKDDKLRLNLQLCYLTISQAIPAVINNIIYSVYIVKYDRYFPVGLSAISGGMSFEEAMENVHLSYAQHYMSFFTHLTNDMAHCFQFYLYVMFSNRFRLGFFERVQQCRTCL